MVGPYTLISQIGRGAFGVVWLAERRTAIATTQVALKLVLDENPDLKSITQESQLWAKVGGHPNVLSIIEAEVYDGQVVIVSEYAPGGSLKEWLERHGKCAPDMESAITMACGILAGLEHLHERRIIHRDLKPANILLNGETPRLADFGLARVLKTGGNSGTIAGTPSYMAPETFDGKRSPQSDIWSVGVILYQMLAGRLPFPQHDVTALIGAIVQRNPEPLPPSVPLMLREVVLRALQKDPARRFQSATEMRETLQRAARTLQNSAGSQNLAASTLRPSAPLVITDSALVSTRLQSVLPDTVYVENKRNTNETFASARTLPHTVLMPPPADPPQGRLFRNLAAGLLVSAVLAAGSYMFYPKKPADNVSTVPVTASSAGARNSETLPAPKPAASAPVNQEERAWNIIKYSNKPEDFDTFLNQFPNSIYDTEARRRRDQLRIAAKKQPTETNQVVTAATPTETAPVTKNYETGSDSGGTIRASNGAVADLAKSPARPAQNYPTPPYFNGQERKYPAIPGSTANVGGRWTEQGGSCSGSEMYITMNGNQVIGVSGTAYCNGKSAQSWTGRDIYWNPNGGELIFTKVIYGTVIQNKIRFTSGNSATKMYRDLKGSNISGQSTLVKN